MIVGFTILAGSITDEVKAKDFIRAHCVLEFSEIADNIVGVVMDDTSVNVYAKEINRSDFSGVPFEYSLIEVMEGEYLVASAVDFKLELPIHKSVKVLKPTEYFRTTIEVAVGFEKEAKQGLIKVFPDVFSLGDTPWILNGGLWNDNGAWVDTNSWKDNE